MRNTSSSFGNDRRKPTAAETKLVMEAALESPVVVESILSLAEANLCPEEGSVQSRMRYTNRIESVTTQAKVLTNSKSPYAQLAGHYLWSAFYRSVGEYPRANSELAAAKNVTMTGEIIRNAEAMANAKFIKNMETRLSWLGEALDTESSFTPSL